MTVNSTRDFIPPEPFEGQNYKPRYARPSASLREELIVHEKENRYPFPDVTIIVIVFVQHRHIEPGFVYNNIYFDITMYKSCNSTSPLVHRYIGFHCS